jgi:hypothetical protein
MCNLDLKAGLESIDDIISRNVEIEEERTAQRSIHKDTSQEPSTPDFVLQ